MDKDLEKLMRLTKDVGEIPNGTNIKTNVSDTNTSTIRKNIEKLSKQESEVSGQKGQSSDNLPFSHVETRPTDKDIFVKIEDHTNVAKTLLSSKEDLKDIADTIFLLAKAEKLKKEALEKMSKKLSELKKKTNEVYNKMAKYGKYVDYKVEQDITKHTLSEVESLSKELEAIKKELEKI